MVALSECGTHAFVAAEVDAYGIGEKTLAARLYPRLKEEELLTADRNFYSFTAWGQAAGTGAQLLWRAPTQLGLPVVTVLPDGTYLSLLIDPKTSPKRRDWLLVEARAGRDPNRGLEQDAAHLVRVIEYTVPDRAGNGHGELIVLLSTILRPQDAAATELASAYHERWEQETANDEMKTHLRGPGRVLRSRVPDLVHQEIWAWLIVHHAMCALIARAAEAADLDPDRISFTRVLRLVRRTATGTAAFPPHCWANEALPVILPQIGRMTIPARRHRTSPRAVKRQYHNSYRLKKRDEPASIRHDGPATIKIHPAAPAAAIDVRNQPEVARIRPDTPAPIEIHPTRRRAA